MLDEYLMSIKGIAEKIGILELKEYCELLERNLGKKVTVYLSRLDGVKSGKIKKKGVLEKGPVFYKISDEESNIKADILLIPGMVAEIEIEGNVYDIYKIFSDEILRT